MEKEAADSSQSSSLCPSGGTGPLKGGKCIFQGTRICQRTTGKTFISSLRGRDGAGVLLFTVGHKQKERKSSDGVIGSPGRWRDFFFFFFALSAPCKKTPWAHEQKITSGTAGNRTLQEMPSAPDGNSAAWRGRAGGGGSLWTWERENVHACTNKRYVSALCW